MAGLGVVGVMLFFGFLAEYVDSIVCIGGLVFGALGMVLFVFFGEWCWIFNDIILVMSVIVVSVLMLMGVVYLIIEYKYV